MDEQEQRSSGIVVKVRAGNGIYPLEGALVTLYSENFGSRSVIANVFTDGTGAAPEIVTALPRGEETLIPPDNRITVEVSKDGYRRGVFEGVGLYEGVVTQLTVNLSPLPDTDGEMLEDYDVEMIGSAHD